MKLQTAVLLLVASSFCIASPIPRPLEARREIPEEILDLAFETFVTIFRTVQGTYPPELLEQLAKELLVTGGRFEFSDELSAQLDAKSVEVKSNLKHALEEIAFAAAGVDALDEETAGKVRLYLDYSVDVLINAIPLDVVEQLLVEVLQNGGSFDFTPELEATLLGALAAVKEEVRKIVDYEFEVFEELIGLDDELRALINQAIDYLADETYQAIPWKLLEDIVYEVIENEGSVELSDSLNVRVEETLESLRQKLREVLESLEEMLFPPRSARVLPEETLQLIYDSLLTMFNKLTEAQLLYQAVDSVVDEVYKIMPWSLFEEIVYTIVSNDGQVDFPADLVDRINSTIDQMAAELKEIMDKATDLLVPKH
ncbi:hypothetical protein AND_000212 [Anopheles darlingi]|uniref:Secreted protein n=1 Tax=Anopheles darlingi TaxID=43151 RepID=W5JUZ4_ANODA|nr:hypothetical protein AND_000212 [Anopheles darlingi]